MDYSKLHKAHPWHGISLGKNVPEEVRAFIEIVPTDTVKYEVDKESGYLSLDRPQKFSNIVPSLYGFLPKSYCGNKVAELTNKSCINPSILILAIPVEVGARNVQVFAKLILGNVPICNDFLYIKRQISVIHTTNPSLLR